MNLDGVSDAEWSELGKADFSGKASLEGLQLAERWVLSGLHQAGTRPVNLPNTYKMHTKKTTDDMCVCIAAFFVAVLVPCKEQRDAESKL